MRSTQFPYGLLGTAAGYTADETKDPNLAEWVLGLTFGTTNSLISGSKTRLNTTLSNKPSTRNIVQERPYYHLHYTRGSLHERSVEQVCQQQLDRHRAIYLYCQGTYERCYRESDSIYGKDFQYDGVHAIDWPDSYGPWPEYQDAWNAYVRAWSYIYGSEQRLQFNPQMRDAILVSTFKLGGHTLLWPGWRWILVQDRTHSCRSRFGEILFPTALDNGESLPSQLEGRMGQVLIEDALYQIDVRNLYPKSEALSEAEKNMAELDATYKEWERGV